MDVRVSIVGCQTIGMNDLRLPRPTAAAVGDPAAGAGVKPGLLGTLTRRDGSRQVTYAGRPLYFYAHEGPGQVLCHNVNLNGGYWWVLAPNGKRRA